MGSNWIQIGLSTVTFANLTVNFVYAFLPIDNFTVFEEEKNYYLAMIITIE